MDPPEVVRARFELADTRHTDVAEIEALRGELVALRTKVESDLDKVQTEVSRARKDAAVLRAQVGALNELQVLKRVRPRKKAVDGSKNQPQPEVVSEPTKPRSMR